MLKKLLCFFIFFLASLILSNSSYGQNKPLGIFEGQSEVGPVLLKGDVEYNTKTKQYIVSGSGADVFFKQDELHYVWKKIKGDFTIRANGAFIGADTHMYGKFGLMVRKSLDGDAAHVNVVVHGNKLSSLQYRKTKGDSTYEQRTGVKTAEVLQLQRKGNTYTMMLANKGGIPESEKVNVDLGDEVYVGLFICSHEANKIKKAVFNNVSIIKLYSTGKRPKRLHQ